MHSWFHLPRNWYRQLDAGYLLLIVALVLVGLVVLSGATQGIPFLHHIWRRQAVWAAVGVMAFMLAFAVNPVFVGTLSIPVYIVNLLLLAALFARGKMIKGAVSWFDLGPFNYQPSETMKLATVAVLAWWLSDSAGRLTPFWKVSGAVVICAMPATLVFLQPDIGTAFIFIALLFGMLFVAGVRKRVLLLGVLILVAAGTAVFPYLRPYQKERLTSFLHPERDQQGSGYNIIQARIALGSGRWTGKGWGEGTQTALRFLPEHHTDFVFSSLAEQFGLAGAAAVLAAFALLLQRMLALLSRCQDEFSLFLGTGSAIVLVAHILYNLGMTLGFLPVSGLPLPFLSYGGTFLVVTLTALGLIHNAALRRFAFAAERKRRQISHVDE
ncbi:MAG: rod shape-determining protein RodA [Candidatus Sumerlaeia bacterium]